MEKLGIFKRYFGPKDITQIKELQSMSKAELLQIAKEKGIEIDPDTKDKSEIIGILSKAEGSK